MKKIILAGCAIIKDNSILLLYRPSRNQHELLGGKIEENENPKEAAKREVKEELCCDIEIIKNLTKEIQTGNISFT